MSSKTKTVAFVGAALLAAAGGVYAFMPEGQVGASAVVKIAQPGATAEKPAADGQQKMPADQTNENIDTKGADQYSNQPPAKVQEALQAPKKLTKAQLTPPPPTEAEKLEKAAQQESNF